MQLSRHTLTNSRDLPIRIDLRRPEQGPAKAAVVVCHGFKGFKDWGFFPYLGERLARAGFASCVFDFSMNGVGERPGEFDRLDLFEQNTFSQELEDAGLVLDWVREGGAGEELAGRPAGLLGHSRGAMAAVVLAAERPVDVGAVVTWNGIGEALRYSERQLARWEQDGRMEFTNARTGQRMAVGYGFVVDAREHAARFDLPAQAARMEAPHRIVQGEADMVVPVEEARALLGGREEGERVQLKLLAGAGHTFQAVHPFAGTTPGLERAVYLAEEWFGRWL